MAFVQGDTGKATHVGWRLVQASFKDLLMQATRGGPGALTEMHELSATFCGYAPADHWQQQDELSLSLVVRAAACLDREHVEHGVTNDLRCITCKFVRVASEAMVDTLFGSVQEEAALRLVVWPISENACGLSEHLVAAATRVLRMTGKSYVLWFLDAVLNMVDHFPSARGAVAYLGEALRLARKTNATVDVVCLDFILGAQRPSRKAVANMLVKRHGSPVLVHFFLMQGVCTKAALQRQKALDHRWSKARHSWCMACMRSTIYIRQERHQFRQVEAGHIGVGHGVHRGPQHRQEMAMATPKRDTRCNRGTRVHEQHQLILRLERFLVPRWTKQVRKKQQHFLVRLLVGSCQNMGYCCPGKQKPGRDAPPPLR
jgi:hypothetical protein